jgi:hypothetical protein
MRCIGSSIHLKNKFGAGYIVNVSVRSSGGSYTDLPIGGAMEHDAHKAEGVKAFFKQVRFHWQEIPGSPTAAICLSPLALSPS